MGWTYSKMPFTRHLCNYSLLLLRLAFSPFLPWTLPGSPFVNRTMLSNIKRKWILEEILLTSTPQMYALGLFIGLTAAYRKGNLLNQFRYSHAARHWKIERSNAF